MLMWEEVSFSSVNNETSTNHVTFLDLALKLKLSLSQEILFLCFLKFWHSVPLY